jgi:lysophospholipase L1-like esterase
LAAGASARAFADNLGQIMPLGDSITWGDAYTWSGGHWGSGTGVETPVPGGYRDQLYRDLHNAGFDFQFVGSKNDNATAALTAAGQAANEGHGGYFTGNISDNLDGSAGGDAGYWLTGTDNRAAVYPDSILLMAGTNDMIGNSNPGYDYVYGLDTLASHVFQLRPNAHVYVSTLLPIPDFPSADAAVRTFDNYEVNGYADDNNFPSQVAKYSAQGFNITLVDPFSQFVNSDGSDNLSLFADGVHPNQAGYNVLGQTWAAALLSGKDLKVIGPVTLRPDASFTLGNIELAPGGSVTFAGPFAQAMKTALLAGIANGDIRADFSGDHAYAVGWIATPDQVEVAGTLLGDTDLDGIVNVVDLANLAENFGGTIGATWQDGDFNSDGNVNVTDLADLAGNFGESVDQQPISANVATDVPEPAGIFGLLVGAALAAGIRRRRRLILG